MKRTTGFTLVELLVVLAIISILAVLGMMGFGSTRGANVTNAAQTVQEAFKLARQLAVTQNRLTEVRFYQTAGTSTASPTYSSLRVEMYDVTGTTASPASHLLILPSNVVMVSAISYSTLLSSTTNPSTLTENLPGAPNTPYTPVQFRASGVTTLNPSGSAPTSSTTDQWFVSLKLLSDPAATSTPAKDFATVQLNPVTGATLLYQPQ